MFWVLFLLLAWAGAVLSCARLILAATAVAGTARPADDGAGRDELSLYEAAYLSGGPQRVAVLTLLSMQRQRRVLLARTGWATVVDPVGRDELERCVLGAIGPDGQSPVEAVRAAAAQDVTVRALARRLDDAGLAVPEPERRSLCEAVRGVKAATVLVVALAVTAALLPQTGADRVLMVWWFALPLVLTVCCLGIARFESHPYSPWASPAGQRLLIRLDDDRRLEGDRGYLTAVAVRGLAAVKDPDLRAALSGGRGRIPAARGH
ncbi:TIGR04222 domain-containing membrane protein [Streptomyces sp. NPDC089919]|uniref:TIGR04222 domain-containing membrane protein n=1 Tax=Streptomyces sp. NPDC089919 TaxID=3155188 RepID=UPI00343BE61C